MDCTKVTQSVSPLFNNYILITNSSSCSNTGPTTVFGGGSQSTVLFRLWREFAGDAPDLEFLVSCNATTRPGIASVDGMKMRFNSINYTTPSFSESTSPQTGILLDPIAAVVQSDLIPLQAAVYFNDDNGIPHDDRVFGQLWMGKAMWDGILAMSAEIWLLASQNVEQRGIQRVEATGMHRDKTAFSALIELLSVWVVEMFAATVALLRPSWTSTLDGYAIARMIQYQPVIARTQEVWFADLEDNHDILEKLQMHQWRSQEI